MLFVTFRFVAKARPMQRSNGRRPPGGGYGPRDGFLRGAPACSAAAPAIAGPLEDVSELMPEGSWHRARNPLTPQELLASSSSRRCHVGGGGILIPAIPSLGFHGLLAPASPQELGGPFPDR